MRIRSHSAACDATPPPGARRHHFAPGAAGALLSLLALLAGAPGAAAQTPAPMPVPTPMPAVPIPAPPQVDASSYILLDHHSGRVLAERNADTPADPASLTKLMTTYVVFGELRSGRLSLDDEVTVSERAWRMGGSKMFIEVGKRIRVEDLLRGVIVQSGNDASIALAEHIAGTEENFARMMETQAQALGLTSSHYRNATGMPAPDHEVSARDIALLSRALIAEYPEYYSLYSEREFTFNDIPQSNRNPLLDTFDGADGLKTGHTEAAGYCLAGSAEREGMRLISVVMGASSPRGRAEASRALLNYGFRFYSTHRLYGPAEPVTTARVWKGAAAEVPLGLARELYITIPRGSYDRLQATTAIRPQILAPVEAAAALGELTITLDGETVAGAPLVSLAAVAEGSFAKRTWDQIMLWFE